MAPVDTKVTERCALPTARAYPNIGDEQLMHASASEWAKSTAHLTCSKSEYRLSMAADVKS